MQHLLAGTAPSLEDLAGSVASEPDVAHLLLEAAREANLELARDAETDANMLEVRPIQSMGSDECVHLLLQTMSSDPASSAAVHACSPDVRMLYQILGSSNDPCLMPHNCGRECISPSA